MTERPPTSLELQRELCRAIAAELGPEALRGYHRQSVRHTLLSLAHIWVAIVLGFWLAGHLVALPWLAAVPLGAGLSFFMATRINALNVLVHEGSHHALAPDRQVNDRLTNLGAGYWILFDTDSYRANHSRHHRFLNEETDPDRPLYEIGRSRAKLVRQLLGDLCWVSIARRASVYRAHSEILDPRHIVGKLVANGAIGLALIGANGIAAGVAIYLLFWVVPLFSFYPMIIRLRLITEHFAPEVFDPETPAFVARTSACGPLEHYLFGAQMDYHFEHHLFPGIPYPQLRRMHADLQRQGFFEGPNVVASNSLSGGYLCYWRRLLASDWFRGADRVVSA